MGDRIAFSRRTVATAVVAAVVAGGCGGAAVYEVADGTYRSLVPSEEQFALDIDGALPGGVARLVEDGVDRIEVEVNTDQVIFRLDGADGATHRIIDRVEVTDSEGSGPFKAKKQVLVLADGPLILGALTIEEPVIWPGSFEESPVITVKPRNRDERGPTVSCRADEPCLLLSSGVEASGSYADANNPELDQNPVDSILIDDRSIEFTLDTGDPIRIPAGNRSTTRACGLSENSLWDLPPAVAPAIDDPVLIHTLCPSTPGAAIQLLIMDRSAIPVLAPITEAREGDWCAAGPACLLFVPT